MAERNCSFFVSFKSTGLRGLSHKNKSYNTHFASCCYPPREAAAAAGGKKEMDYFPLDVTLSCKRL